MITDEFVKENMLNSEESETESCIEEFNEVERDAKESSHSSTDIRNSYVDTKNGGVDRANFERNKNVQPKCHQKEAK